MNYSDLDPDLMAWGVATEVAGSLQVQACRSQSDAGKAAKSAPKLTTDGKHPVTGAHHTVSDVFPLVYYNPDDGWTFAAIGWPVPSA